MKEALDRGASAIVTEDANVEVPVSVAKICVNDARKTLAKFSKRYYGNPDEHLSIVGVTGTNGKTTVTTLIRHLLEEPGKPVGLIGTVRYHLGDREVPSFRTTPESTDLYSLLKYARWRLFKGGDGGKFPWDPSGKGIRFKYWSIRFSNLLVIISIIAGTWALMRRKIFERKASPGCCSEW